MPQNQLYKSISTAGNGDCAFHAIFGEYDAAKKQFFCRNVANQRREVAALITQQYLDGNNDYLIQVVNTGLFEIGNTSAEARLCPNIVALKEYLFSQKHQNTEYYKKLLISAIKNNKQFQEKINKFLRVKAPNSNLNGIWDKFMHFTNENRNDVIYNVIKQCSGPEDLLKAYVNYKEANDSLKNDAIELDRLVEQYFLDFPGTKNAVLQELAGNIISKSGAWVPQHFIPAIAICSNKKVFLYTNNPKTNQLNDGQVYNGQVDDTAQEVKIYFNGRNHYERVVDLDFSALKPPTSATQSCQPITIERPSPIITSGRVEAAPLPLETKTSFQPLLPKKGMQIRPTNKLTKPINNQQLKKYFKNTGFTKLGLEYKNKAKDNFEKTGVSGEIITTRALKEKDQTIPKNTVLATFKASSVECQVMQNSTNNSGRVLLGVQQQILLDSLRLYSKQAIQEKVTKPIIIEADNFNPEDLQVLLEMLIIKPIPLISIELPPQPKNVNQQTYTMQDIAKIDALITEYNVKQSASFSSSSRKPYRM